ncbi:hypothetical protein DYB25_008232, partial [Aphanomyces astaci]
SEKDCTGVLAEFNTLGDLSVAEPPSNTTNHRTTVPKTRAVRDLVRTFIRDRSVTRTRTVGKDVSRLKEHNVVSVDVSCKKSYGSCLRAVQSYLAKQGYARGKRVGATEYRMSKAHEDARDAYVGMMVPTVMILYHPDDPMTKSKHKGRRYCFIAGILDDGSDVAHLLGLDIFVGGKKSGKIVKDYHAMFNHDYFVDWFGKLLDEVEELGWSSAVFVMDNAKYHKGNPKSTPKGSWKKADLYQACLDRSVPNVAPTDLKTTIWKALKTHLDEHVLPVVVAMAQNRGHHVVYSAPGFSELQPIELVWANVKGTVGRAYTSTTTFQDVRDRLEKAFFELDTEVIHNTIESSTAKLLKLHRALHDAEAGAADLCREESESDASSDVDTSSSSVCDSMSGSDSDD